MTPEEILRDLRDIHLPEKAADAAGAGLALWPAALVIVVAAIAALLAWQRRSAWRRDIAKNLEAIDRHADDGRIMEGWNDLAVLLRRLALGLEGRRDIAGLVGESWLERLDHLLQTDIFSRGAGRGVTVYPYQERIVEDRVRIADELKTTIDIIRRRLPHLRMTA